MCGDAMKRSTDKQAAGSTRPPAFPGLTKPQKDWIAARRSELKTAIEAGIESGKTDGYRAFDADRILAFIEQRRPKKSRTRKSHG
jgi:hypothetical protein